MKELINQLLFIAGVATCLYYIPYLIRLGWNNAENKTRKVCNLCFRDISEFNKKYEELTAHKSKGK